MALKHHSVFKVALSIVSAGIILFLSVFVGIRIGAAWKGERAGPPPSGARSHGKPTVGDPIPSLALFADKDHKTDLRSVVGGSKALVAFTMPGCSSCEEVLSGWKAGGIADRQNGTRVIVVVSTPPGDFDAAELAPFSSSYPLYFCDSPDLYFGLDMPGLPTVLGITGDGIVGFFRDDATSVRDIAYLRRFL